MTETKPKFQLIDYYTGKPVNDLFYETEYKAHKAKNEYLKQCVIDKRIYNNLITIHKLSV